MYRVNQWNLKHGIGFGLAWAFSMWNETTLSSLVYVELDLAFDEYGSNMSLAVS